MGADDLLLGRPSATEEIGKSSFLSVIDSYRRYYADGNSHTARAKRLDLDHFIDFLTSYRALSKPEKLKVRDFDHSAVQRFVEHCLDKGEAPATVSRRLATIKHMGRTLSEKIAGFINPAREVKPPKARPVRPKGLSDTDVKEVRTTAQSRVASKSSFIRLRNQTLFDFLLDTGIRADEVRTLRFGQLDEDLEWVHSVRTKGRRYRNVYITSAMRPALREYMEVRERELKRYFAKLSPAKNKKLPLFISTYGADADKPESFLMGAKTIWRAINELSAEVHLHPHLLRHSYALDLLDSSKDVRLVAQALGHSDVRVTMRYTERSGEEVAAALEKSRQSDKK